LQPRKLALKQGPRNVSSQQQDLTHKPAIHNVTLQKLVSIRLQVPIDRSSYCDIVCCLCAPSLQYMGLRSIQYSHYESVHPITRKGCPTRSGNLTMVAGNVNDMIYPVCLPRILVTRSDSSCHKSYCNVQPVEGQSHIFPWFLGISRHRSQGQTTEHNREQWTSLYRR
jgi:hypothetical protein